jgi:hypothetical protein
VTETPKADNGVWKAIALVLAGVVISLLGCIWNQSQDRATKADLVPIAQNVSITQTQVQTLNEQFQFLEGQLRAKKVIEGKE